jgi:hypothetical protein
MAWQTPKTSWKAGDIPLASDFNRIEGNVGELDTKKANQADLASHTDASAPHSGHATTSALSGHTGATTAHAATSAATASRIMMRDAYGRAKVAAPSAADDIARLDSITKTQAGLGNVTNDKQATKAEFDAKMHATTGHKHTGVAGQGPLLGVDSQVWMQPGNDVILEDLPEKTVYTVGIFKYKVPYPGKYRLTGEFRLQEGESTTVQFGFLEDVWRYGVSTGHVRELIPVTVSATSTTMSLSFSSFTLDLSRARPTPGYLYVVVAVDAGSWGDPESRVRNLRVRGTPAAGNPSWL